MNTSFYVLLSLYLSIGVVFALGISSGMRVSLTAQSTLEEVAESRFEGDRERARRAVLIWTVIFWPTILRRFRHLIADARARRRVALAGGTGRRCVADRRGGEK